MPLLCWAQALCTVVILEREEAEEGPCPLLEVQACAPVRWPVGWLAIRVCDLKDGNDSRGLKAKTYVMTGKVSHTRVAEPALPRCPAAIDIFSSTRQAGLIPPLQAKLATMPAHSTRLTSQVPHRVRRLTGYPQQDPQRAAQRLCARHAYGISTSADSVPLQQKVTCSAHTQFRWLSDEPRAKKRSVNQRTRVGRQDTVVSTSCSTSPPLWRPSFHMQWKMVLT
ncbi:hypothetical protein WJX79_001956 [Trebouxia sp. C0005]